MVKDTRHRTRGLALPDQTVLELRQRIDRSSGKINRTVALTDYDQEDETLWRVAEASADLDVNEQARSMGLLRLLTAIQDEAHRFALQYQRKLSKKRHVRFSLEQIKGVGPARRRLLLEHFGSIKAVSESTLTELEAVDGLGRLAASAIYQHFHLPEPEHKPADDTINEIGESSR